MQRFQGFVRSCLLFLVVLPAGLSAQLRRDTLFVIPANGVLVDFQTQFDGTVQHSGSDRFVMRLLPDTGAASWLYPMSWFETAPNLFPECVYVNPFMQNNSTNWYSDLFFIRPKKYFRIDEYKGGQTHWGLRKRDGYRAPASVCYQLDTGALHVTIKGKLWADSITRAHAAAYSHPFYFRKTEVSNVEYRTFVNWVRDSIAHERLGHKRADGQLDWTQPLTYSDSVVAARIDLLVEDEERFNRQPKIDSRKLVYRFVQRPAGFAVDTIAIYPDTLSWSRDFEYTYYNPQIHFYFWHPAYNTYPITGVSYWQCLAYLDWLTQQTNKELARKGLKAEYRLPSAAEWDLVSTAETHEQKMVLMGSEYAFLCDNSWLTDLRVNYTPTKKQIAFQQGNFPVDTLPSIISSRSSNTLKYYPLINTYPLRKLLYNNSGYYRDISLDGGFQTEPVQAGQLGQKKAFLSRKQQRAFAANPLLQIHLDPNGISHLDDNVSEWLRDDLNAGWRPLLQLRLNTWSPLMTDQDSLVRGIEQYYFNQLPQQGKLVMGGNWIDKRYSFYKGKNPAGYTAKTFLHPSETHCTVGFRYVIYVSPAAPATAPKSK